jgi:glycyl-tRNA synthetase beta chain
VPTGSKDPFALRRAAQGIVKILVESKLPYTLKSLMDNDFMRERIQYYFREVKEFKYDEVNAVMAAGVATLADLEARLVALAAIRSTPDFEPLASSFKRIKNILRQANFVPDPDAVLEMVDTPNLEDADRLLQKEYERVNILARGTDYRKGLEMVASIRPAVDNFFDKVMVNATDQAVRRARLTILDCLLTEFSTIADFSEIVTSEDQK